jgi:hypothetical protein
MIPDERRAVLYLAIETWQPGRASDVYAWFDAHGRGLPNDVTVVGSWIDHDLRRCWQVMDTDDPAVFDAWRDHWAHLMDIEVIPVRSGTDTAALVRAGGAGD